ncbi:MAG: hypothetical protein ABI594_20300 [Ginsengibacter sp.]
MAKSKSVAKKPIAVPLKKASPTKVASAAKPAKLGGVPNQGRMPKTK